MFNDLSLSVGRPCCCGLYSLTSVSRLASVRSVAVACKPLPNLGLCGDLLLTQADSRTDPLLERRQLHDSVFWPKPFPPFEIFGHALIGLSLVSGHHGLEPLGFLDLPPGSLIAPLARSRLLLLAFLLGLGLFERRILFDDQRPRFGFSWWLAAAEGEVAPFVGVAIPRACFAERAGEQGRKHVIGPLDLESQALAGKAEPESLVDPLVAITADHDEVVGLLAAEVFVASVVDLEA